MIKISATSKSSKCSDSKSIQEYIINYSASNINEGFVLNTLHMLVDQSVLFNSPTAFGDPYYIVKSNCSAKFNIPIDCDTLLKVIHRAKCNIPIDCDTLLKVIRRDVQDDNDKNVNSTYPKKMNVTQDA